MSGEMIAILGVGVALASTSGTGRRRRSNRFGDVLAFHYEGNIDLKKTTQT